MVIPGEPLEVKIQHIGMSNGNMVVGITGTREAMAVGHQMHHAAWMLNAGKGVVEEEDKYVY